MIKLKNVYKKRSTCSFEVDLQFDCNNFFQDLDYSLFNTEVQPSL